MGLATHKQVVQLNAYGGLGFMVVGVGLHTNCYHKSKADDVAVICSTLIMGGRWDWLLHKQVVQLNAHPYCSPQGHLQTTKQELHSSSLCPLYP